MQNPPHVGLFETHWRCSRGHKWEGVVHMRSISLQTGDKTFGPFCTECIFELLEKLPVGIATSVDASKGERK